MIMIIRLVRYNNKNHEHNHDTKSDEHSNNTSSSETTTALIPKWALHLGPGVRRQSVGVWRFFGSEP